MYGNQWLVITHHINFYYKLIMVMQVKLRAIFIDYTYTGGYGFSLIPRGLVSSLDASFRPGWYSIAIGLFLKNQYFHGFLCLVVCQIAIFLAKCEW